LPWITTPADLIAKSTRPRADQSITPKTPPGACRGLRSGHSIPIGEAKSAHREAASSSAFVSARPTVPGVRPRSATALRIQDSAIHAATEFTCIAAMVLAWVPCSSTLRARTHSLPIGPDRGHGLSTVDRSAGSVRVCFGGTPRAARRWGRGAGMAQEAVGNALKSRQSASNRLRARSNEPVVFVSTKE
jgi:hypothetical protein